MPDINKLRLAIDLECKDAYGSSNDQLNQERATSLDYYLGRPLGNEVEGRSQIVSHDVMDTVEWQKPALLRIFAGGQDIVKFNPKGPEDVEAAEQESSFINFVLTQKNDWFAFCYNWITDALITRNAYALAYWDEDRDYSLENYQGLTDDQMAFVLRDVQSGRIEVIAHNAYPAPMPPQPGVDPQTGQPVLLPPPNLHDLQIRVISGSEHACITALPPERCLVSQRCREMSLSDSPYFEYYDMKTVSELREMGFDVPDDLPRDAFTETEEVDQARNVGDLYRSEQAANEVDPAMRRVKVRMIWIRHDYNEDGIAELNYVVRVADRFLHIEEVETIPVACIVPTIMPHRHVGLSTSDNTHDIQEVDTMLIRGMIDNLFRANNTETGISNKVNLEDMLTSRPGGIKRVDTDMGDVAGHIMPYKQPVVMQEALAGLEFMQQMREGRTGVSRYTQGQDLNALNRTASGVAQLTSAASQRLELIARVIATGMRELFRIVHELTLKHSTYAQTVELNNKWVSVDPRQWKKRQDMTIAVGMGVGNREQSMANLMQIFQMQLPLLQVGVVRPDNIYHTFTEIVKAAGFAAAERFATDPMTNPPPQPQPDPLEVGKLQIQGFDAQTKRMQLMIDQKRVDIERAKAEQEPVENARDRKLDLMLESIKEVKAAAASKGNGEDRAPPVSVTIEPSKEMMDKVQNVDQSLRDEIEQNMNTLTKVFGEQLEQVRAEAQRKRKMKVVRGKRGRIEGIEEAE